MAGNSRASVAVGDKDMAQALAAASSEIALLRCRLAGVKELGVLVDGAPAQSLVNSTPIDSREVQRASFGHFGVRRPIVSSVVRTYFGRQRVIT
mmetsp:Transcript_21562/g.51092  ORF Transcript_21562/g.51092 Transcript_21562/m.51092 type:complete len:94 (+) Transcript_21562:104-385(+)